MLQPVEEDDGEPSAEDDDGESDIQLDPFD